MSRTAPEAEVLSGGMGAIGKPFVSHIESLGDAMPGLVLEHLDLHPHGDVGSFNSIAHTISAVLSAGDARDSDRMPALGHDDRAPDRERPVSQLGVRPFVIP